MFSTPVFRFLGSLISTTLNPLISILQAHSISHSIEVDSGGKLTPLSETSSLLRHENDDKNDEIEFENAVDSKIVNYQHHREMITNSKEQYSFLESLLTKSDSQSDNFGFYDQISNLITNVLQWMGIKPDDNNGDGDGDGDSDGDGLSWTERQLMRIDPGCKVWDDLTNANIITGRDVNCKECYSLTDQIQQRKNKLTHSIYSERYVLSDDYSLLFQLHPSLNNFRYVNFTGEKMYLDFGTSDNATISNLEAELVKRYLYNEEYASVRQCVRKRLVAKKQETNGMNINTTQVSVMYPPMLYNNTDVNADDTKENIIQYHYFYCDMWHHRHSKITPTLRLREIHANQCADVCLRDSLCISSIIDENNKCQTCTLNCDFSFDKDLCREEGNDMIGSHMTFSNYVAKSYSEKKERVHGVINTLRYKAEYYSPYANAPAYNRNDVDLNPECYFSAIPCESQYDCETTCPRQLGCVGYGLDSADNQYKLCFKSNNINLDFEKGQGSRTTGTLLYGLNENYEELEEEPLIYINKFRHYNFTQSSCIEKRLYGFPSDNSKKYQNLFNRAVMPGNDNSVAIDDIFKCDNAEDCKTKCNLYRCNTIALRRPIIASCTSTTTTTTSTTTITTTTANGLAENINDAIIETELSDIPELGGYILFSTMRELHKAESGCAVRNDNPCPDVNMESYKLISRVWKTGLNPYPQYYIDIYGEEYYNEVWGKRCYNESDRGQRIPCEN